MLFKSRKKYRMNMEQANATLQNVFAACNQTPNTIPFDKLVLRKKLNTRVYNRMIVLTALLLFITFLAPLAVAPVSVFLSRQPEKVTLLSDSIENGVICLTLSGDGILYTEAYQETADGIKEAPLSYDKDTGTIYFTYYETATNIYIPIENAPTFHLLLSPQ